MARAREQAALAGAELDGGFVGGADLSKPPTGEPGTAMPRAEAIRARLEAEMRNRRN